MIGIEIIDMMINDMYLCLKQVNNNK